VTQSTAAGKGPIVAAGNQPQPKAVPIPMGQVVIQQPPGLLGRSQAAQRGHHARVLMHPAQRIEVIGTQAFGPQAGGFERRHIRHGIFY
jgi:hypothetical protein